VLQQSLLLATSFREAAVKEDTAISPSLTLTTIQQKMNLGFGLKPTLIFTPLNIRKVNFKKLLKRKRFFWETTRVRHMCAFAKVDAFLFWKSTGQWHS
jgi:hypothetical protein